MKKQNDDGVCFCDRFIIRPVTFDEVEKRCSEVSEHSLRPHLSVVKTAKNGWHTLYKCKTCDRYWAVEYPFGEQQGGGPSCFYILNGKDPIREWEQEAGWINQVRQVHEDKIFFDSLGLESGPENCRQLNCQRKRIALGVNCKIHHFEMLKKRPAPI